MLGSTNPSFFHLSRKHDSAVGADHFESCIAFDRSCHQKRRFAVAGQKANLVDANLRVRLRGNGGGCE